jgi:protein O-mannosyl-transferase
MSKRATQRKKNQASTPETIVQKTTAQTKKGNGNRQVTQERFITQHKPALIVLAVLAILLYVKSVSFQYVLDDGLLITQNAYTQKGISGIGDIFSNESFKGYFTEDELVEGGRYRPLSIASFAVEHSLFGQKPAISHFINVLLYALSALLLFRVLHFMFGAFKARDQKWYFTIPFVATALFLVHPLHIEVVANIKGRDEIFAFLAECGVLYYTFRYLADEKSKYLLYSFLCYFLGILSKEGVITFLAVIPVTAYFFSNSSTLTKVKLTMPLLAGTVIYLVMRYAALGYLNSGVEVTNLMNNPFYGLSFGDKTATIFYTLLLYLKLLVFPHPLTHDYYPYHIPVMHWNDVWPVISLVVYTALFIVAVKGWQRKSVPAYSILFYLLTLSIVSNLFVSIGTFMNERFLYHASLGFCIAVAWLLVNKMSVNATMRKAALAIFMVMSLGFIVKVQDRLPDWKDQAALDQSAIKVSFNSARANHFYGRQIWDSVYLKLPPTALPAQRIAVLDSMKPYFYKALTILPDYYNANAMKAGIAAEYHKLDQNYAALIKVFEEVNRTGIYEKFLVDYLRYLNQVVGNRTDATMLDAFYGRMIAFYDSTKKNTNLPGDYRALQTEIRTRLTQLP